MPTTSDEGRGPDPGGEGLGAFLRARRGALAPGDAGLAPIAGDRRRVPGLRREEVAMLAGVSHDYYTRLEQGRERTPSAQVIDALAAALRLPDDAHDHLCRLAGTARTSPGPTRRGVDPALRELMAAWPDNPALVYDRAYDVLAANGIADALFCSWPHSRNLLEVVFNWPGARTFYADWPRVAADSVAGFRHGHGRDPHHPRTRAVLATALTDPEFARLWARHDVRAKSLQRKRFQHPDVGAIELTMQTFDVRSAPGQELVVYHADPGSPSAHALRLLGSLAATAATDGDAAQDGAAQNSVG